MRHSISIVLLIFWFSSLSFAQTFKDSNLPVVIIVTDNGIEIPDEPKISASMKIIFNGDRKRNYLTDQNTPASLNYNGKIAIEIRGSSTQILPKKQYGFTTVKADNLSNNNVSLLGLPVENDWILNGLGFDPSLMRDYLSYNLMRKMGNYASRTVYCEVMINGDYKGLYVLQEKIKAGLDRVDVVKIGATDNLLPNLSGGYITKADKTSTGEPIAWTMPGNLAGQTVTYLHELPKPENATLQQTSYIKGIFESMSIAVRDGNVSLSNGYPSVIDVPSFVDYMIISELASNVDSYQFSTFFHKDRGGKLRAGPIWDFNLTYGNDIFIWDLNRSHDNVWQFSNGDNEGSTFWKGLFSDSKFNCLLVKRWNELTKKGAPLNLAEIKSFLSQTDQLILEAVIREKARWNTFTNHELEVSLLESFIENRIGWMNQNLNTANSCVNDFIPSLVISKINYNPATSLDFPKSNDLEFIEISNNSNKTIDLTGIYLGGTGLVYQFPPKATIQANSKLCLASNLISFESKYKIKAFDQFLRNLSNQSQKILLLDGFGNKIDEVDYSAEAPWPDANGNGSFLELKNLDAENNLPENWGTNNRLVFSSTLTESPQLSYYPNPVRDILMIKALDYINQLAVYSEQGQLLQLQFPFSTNYSLDMTPLTSGFYLVRLNTPSGNYTLKIIKL
jgi:hypothetical protein